MNIPITLLMFCTSIVYGVKIIPPDIEQQIEETIQEFRIINRVPALSLAITKGEDEIIFTSAFGSSDIENSKQADENTIFGIGSVSKSFTAILVVKALNEMFPQLKEAALDTPIVQLAPSYNFILGDRYRSETVTFRDLLSHRVCTMPEVLGSFFDVYSSSEQFFHGLRYAPEQCSLRNGFLYNNGLVGIAGDVISHIANSSFPEMLSQLLKDLDMGATTWVKSTDNHNQMENRSVPYLFVGSDWVRYNTELMKSVEILTGSGGILSTANDMLKYMKFHLNKGKIGEIQVVPEEVINWLYKISNPVFAGVTRKDNDSSPLDVTAGYGLCLEIGIYDGFFRIAHGGYLPTYHSRLSLYPEINLGIYSALSGPGELSFGPRPLTWLHNRIFDILKGINRTTQVPVSHQQLQIDYNKNALVSNAVKVSEDEAVGSYGNGFNGNLTISWKQNPATQEKQLYLSFGRWGKAWFNSTSLPHIFHIASWDSDFWMIYASYMFIPFANIPKIVFLDKDTVVFEDNISGVLSDKLIRNFDIGTLPEIPWKQEDQCNSGIIFKSEILVSLTVIFAIIFVIV